MVEVAGMSEAVRRLKGQLRRKLLVVAGAFVAAAIFYTSCTARVGPTEYGIEQRTIGMHTGVVDRVYEPGLYFLPPGATIRTFPRGVQVLEASADREEARARAPERAEAIDGYFNRRDRILGASHRVMPAINVQTSDGYAVSADVTLLYVIVDPLQVARTFGWGSAYVDSFVINTFRNSLLATLGKLNAESFYDAAARIAAVRDAEAFMGARFAERGFKVEKLLLRSYKYAPDYERSLQDKKVAVQLAEKNRREAAVNAEQAKLQQIASRGNAAITIAESEVNAEIARIRAESQLYASETRAKADRDAGLAQAEAKRLKSEALTQTGGRYVMALETAKMFDNIAGAAMTPEQYISFIRSAWALVGLNPGGRTSEAPAREWAMRAIALVVLLAAGCSGTSSTEVGIRTNMLGLFEKRGQQQIYQPGGVYFVMPIVNTWHTLSIAQQNLMMNASPDEGDRPVPDDINFKTRDGNNIHIDVNLLWRIDPAQAGLILSRVGRSLEDVKERVVRPIARSVIRDVFNEITSEEYYHVTVKNRMADKARTELAQTLQRFGILVDMLQVQEHRFDPGYQAAINAQKQADADIQKLIEQQKNMEVQKQTELAAKRAEWNKRKEDALGEAGRVRNEADGYYQTTSNSAKAVLAQSQAETEALRKEAAALNRPGGESYVKMQIAKLLAGKKILIVPASNVSTMNVNDMMGFLLGKNAGDK